MEYFNPFPCGLFMEVKSMADAKNYPTLILTVKLNMLTGTFFALQGAL